MPAAFGGPNECERKSLRAYSWNPEVFCREAAALIGRKGRKRRQPIALEPEMPSVFEARRCRADRHWLKDGDVGAVLDVADGLNADDLDPSPSR